MVNADQYKPIHVTEVDEARWDDCRVCSALMLVEMWTFGEVLQKKDGEFLTPKQIKKFREAMRDRLPADRQEGGLGPDDTKQMIAKAWPWLPEVKQPQPKFYELWDKLGKNYSYSVSGNPADVQKPESKLRQWTRNDDFGHEVLAVRTNADKSKVLVFDPLAPLNVGGKRYKGQWVPKEEFKQFLYLGGDGTVTYCSEVKIGTQSRANRIARQKNGEIMRLETANELKVSRLRAQIGDLQRQVVDGSESYQRGRADAMATVEAWADALVEDLDDIIDTIEEGPDVG